MSEYIVGYVGKEDLKWFQEMKDEARTRAIYISTFAVRQDDFEVSIRIKSDDEINTERIDMLQALKNELK